ncbi:hypothetical protein AAZX31_14G154900 [Glycine max]
MKLEHEWDAIRYLSCRLNGMTLLSDPTVLSGSSQRTRI